MKIGITQKTPLGDQADLLIPITAIIDITEEKTRNGERAGGADILRPSTESAQACGSGTEAKIGGDRDSIRIQSVRERVSNRKAETGRRDYDNYQSVFFC